MASVRQSKGSLVLHEGHISRRVAGLAKVPLALFILAEAHYNGLSLCLVLTAGGPPVVRK